MENRWVTGLFAEQLEDFILEELFGVMDGMVVFNKPDACHIPFVVAKWMGKHVDFCFTCLSVEFIIVFPLLDCSCCPHLDDRDPADDFLVFVLDWVKLNGYVVHLLFEKCKSASSTTS